MNTGQGEIQGAAGGTITITDASGPFTLTAIELGELGDSKTVTLLGLDAQGDVVASATVTTSASNGFPETVFNTAGTAFAGVELAKLELVPHDSNDTVLFNDITATHFTINSVFFTDKTNVANNVTVTDANGDTVPLADLTSHGQAVEFALLDGQTLVAYTGTTAPGTVHDASVVFSVALSAATANGSYDYVLDQPLDQLSGTGCALNLTFSYTAQDFDGSIASGTFTVTDTDDAPVLTGAASGTVFEAGLNVTDPFGTGTALFNPNDPTSASGGLGVHFGADGPAATGGVVFADQTTAANNVTVTDGAGHAVALTGLTSHGEALSFELSNPETLVAYTTSPSDPVFTVTLSAASKGGYTFVLDQPLDQPLTGTDGLNLTFNFAAHDFDGSTASGSFTVTDTDDVPMLTGALAAPFFAGVFEDVLPGGTQAGDGSATTGTGNGTLDPLVNFGADGPNPTPFQFVANAATALTNLGILSHGNSVDFADITTTAGVGTTLAAYTGGSTSGTEVFTLTLDDNGAWTFTLLAPIDHNGNETLDSRASSRPSISTATASRFSGERNRGHRARTTRRSPTSFRRPSPRTPARRRSRRSAPISAMAQMVRPPPARSRSTVS